MLSDLRCDRITRAAACISTQQLSCEALSWRQNFLVTGRLSRRRDCLVSSPGKLNAPRPGAPQTLRTSKARWSNFAPIRDGLLAAPDGKPGSVLTIDTVGSDRERSASRSSPCFRNRARMFSPQRRRVFCDVARRYFGGTRVLSRPRQAPTARCPPSRTTSYPGVLGMLRSPSLSSPLSG
jgi:hypothetical protein